MGLVFGGFYLFVFSVLGFWGFFGCFWFFLLFEVLLVIFLRKGKGNSRKTMAEELTA